MNQSKALFVIVSVSQETAIFPAPGKHYVLPALEPTTYGTLDEAAEMLAHTLGVCGYTVETAPIFKLEPVPVDEVEAAVERARARLAKEMV